MPSYVELGSCGFGEIELRRDRSRQTPRLRHVRRVRGRAAALSRAAAARSRASATASRFSGLRTRPVAIATLPGALLTNLPLKV
jgi:hypothetical protein